VEGTGFTDCEKNVAREILKKHVAGAEARADFEAVSARLKSCPVTKLRWDSGGLNFFAACSARTSEAHKKDVGLLPLKVASRDNTHLDQAAAFVQPSSGWIKTPKMRSI
jgi:hypothetical protein